MKRFLMACLGMVLLGAAGLLVLHQVVEFPAAARAQPGAGGVAVGAPGVGAPGKGAPAEAGQFKDIVPPLLESLADADGGVRQLAAATLVKIGSDAAPPLIEALQAKDRETRANAAYVLGHLSPLPREALPALAKTLKDDDKEVRRRAAYAIHNLVGHAEPTELVAAPPGAGGEGGGGMPVPPRLAMRGSAPGGHVVAGSLMPLDPGLLLPEMKVPPAKPEKESKKD
jgi:hypothetical protein